MNLNSEPLQFSLYYLLVNPRIAELPCAGSNQFSNNSDRRADECDADTLSNSDQPQYGCPAFRFSGIRRVELRFPQGLAA